MKNELGDIPKVSLDEEVSIEDELPKTEEKIEREEVVLPKEEIVESKKLKDSKQPSPKSNLTDKEKFNKLLTIVLVATITIAVIILLGFGIKKLIDLGNAKKAAEELKKPGNEVGIGEGPGSTNVDGSGNPILNDDSSLYQGSQIKQKRYHKGYEIVGEIRIPKTKLNEYIVIPMSNNSLEVAVAMEHTLAGINEVGNTVISGHNYKNEQFFAKNYKIEIGDLIYIKDETGRELKYTVVQIDEKSENDKSFYVRNNGIPEITLSTCTDNVVNRIVIFAEHRPEAE